MSILQVLFGVAVAAAVFTVAARLTRRREIPGRPSAPRAGVQPPASPPAPFRDNGIIITSQEDTR